MPAVKDLEIYQGDDWSMTVRLRARAADGTLGNYLNLTGGVGKAQVRTTQDDTTVAAEMTVTVNDQTVDPGSVTLALSSAQTTALSGKYVWDWQMILNSLVTTYLAGSLLCDKQVTR